MVIDIIKEEDRADRLISLLGHVKYEGLHQYTLKSLEIILAETLIKVRSELNNGKK